MLHVYFALIVFVLISGVISVMPTRPAATVYYEQSMYFDDCYRSVSFHIHVSSLSGYSICEVCLFRSGNLHIESQCTYSASRQYLYLTD